MRRSFGQQHAEEQRGERADPGQRAEHRKPCPVPLAPRAFNLVAWPAFAVLLLTGVWNVIAVRGQITGSYQVTLIVKLVVVAVSGVTAALHARAGSTGNKAGLAVFGALTGISALAALFLGVLLAE